MAVDALGNEIVVGEKYGYSSPSSSVTRVVVGRAIGSTEKKVRLELLSVREFMGGEEITLFGMRAKALTIASYLLFPVK